MSVINSNLPAVASTGYLDQSQEMLARSLTRLSSDSRIINLPDDASGLAASDNLAAQNRRAQAATTGVQNAVSYLQTADSFMSGVEKILSRMNELAGLAKDGSKNPGEIASNQAEFQSLQDQLRTTIGDTAGTAPSAFSGSALFGSSATGFAVNIPQPGLQQAALQGVISQNPSGVYDLNTATPDAMAQITGALQHVAVERVTLGASQSQLQLAASTLMIEQVNLGAAIPRIGDAGVAAESTQFAKYNILAQSGTAMQAQANLSPSAVLRLL